MIVLSRGKCKDSDEWIEGSLVFTNIIIPNTNDNMFFHYVNAKDSMTLGTGKYLTKDSVLKFYIVDPETVSSYIGLTDKNNKNIFEGDICENGERTYLICWLDNQYTWGCFNLKTCRKTPIYQVISREGNNFEIIGNRYDNPEMLRTASLSDVENISQPVLQPATPENFELMNG